MKKMLRISFDIDVVQLLEAMTGSSAMQIDVFDGDKPKPSGHHQPVKAISKAALAKKTKEKIYPGKSKNKNGNRPTRQLILQHMITRDAPVHLAELNKIAFDNKNTKSATSVGLDWMKKRKWVKRVGPGVWQVTDLGKQQRLSEKSES